MQKKPKNARSKGLPEPLPATCTVPEAGHHFFGVDTPGAYRLARKGIIPVLKTGRRNGRVAPRVGGKAKSRSTGHRIAERRPGGAALCIPTIRLRRPPLGRARDVAKPRELRQPDLHL